jgi:hypothetical protein
MRLALFVSSRARRRAVAAAGFLLLFGVSGVTAASADTDLGGFQVGASAAAVSFIYNQPSFGVSTAPCPTFPFDLARTTAFSDQASGHSLASVAWPCDFFANALPLLGTMIPPPLGPRDDIPAYPVRAETFYPQGPTNQQSGAPVAQMSASSLEGASLASANFGSLTFPGVIAVGQVTSTAQGNRTTNGTLSTATSTLHNVDILNGTIHFDSIKSTVTAESDTQTAKVSGGVTYAGLTVLGQPAVIDADGIHFQPEPPTSSKSSGIGKNRSAVPAGASPSPTPTPSPSPTASPPPPDGPVGKVVNPILQQLEKQLETQLTKLGIEFSPTSVIDVVEGASGSREVSGIEISIKGETIQPYIDRLPKAIRDQISKQMTFDQTITLLLGSANAKAAASPAFTPPPILPPLGPTIGGTFPTGDFTGGFTTPPSGTTPGFVPTGTLITAKGIPISTLLLILAFGLAAVAAGGLRRFADAATTASVVERCELEKT